MRPVAAGGTHRRQHGYGIPDDQTLEAIGLAGLIDLVANGEIDRGSNVLYAHLGGQPALNAYGALFTG